MLLLLMGVCGWRIHQISVLRRQLYPLDGNQVRVRLDRIRGNRVNLSKVWVDGAWLDIRTLKVPFSQTNACAAATQNTELVGILLLQKPV